MSDTINPVAWLYQHDETDRTMLTHQPPDRVDPNDLRRWSVVSALYTADALATLREENERLREELAAAQRDATLFLWLADAEPFSARWQIVRLEWWRGRDGWSEVRGDALRAAIEAAMAKEKRDE